MIDETTKNFVEVEIAEAAIKTITTPSLPVVAEDLLLIHKLVNEVKAKLDGKHPTLGTIFQALFNLS